LIGAKAKLADAKQLKDAHEAAAQRAALHGLADGSGLRPPRPK
jgi:hypothetical protein